VTVAETVSDRGAGRREVTSLEFALDHVTTAISAIRGESAELSTWANLQVAKSTLEALTEDRSATESVTAAEVDDLIERCRQDAAWFRRRADEMDDLADRWEAAMATHEREQRTVERLDELEESLKNALTRLNLHLATCSAAQK
jgi:chromosome segregation ATPase